MLISELNIWYLEDTPMVVSLILNYFKCLISEFKKIGLEVNPSKCELFFCGKEDKSVIKQFNAVSPQIKVLKVIWIYWVHP